MRYPIQNQQGPGNPSALPEGKQPGKQGKQDALIAISRYIEMGCNCAGVEIHGHEQGELAVIAFCALRVTLAEACSHFGQGRGVHLPLNQP